MSQVDENVTAARPSVDNPEDEQSENSSAPPTMFKIVKMFKLRWQVLLVEAPEGQRYPFGLERCLSVNAIKTSSQQLKSRRRWSASLPSPPRSKVLACECIPALEAEEPPAVSPWPGSGDLQDPISSSASKASLCCENRTSGRLLHPSEQWPNHGAPRGGLLSGPLGDLLLSTLSSPEEVDSPGDHGDVAQTEPAPREASSTTAAADSSTAGDGGGRSSSNSHLKVNKEASSEQRVLTPVQQQRLAKRASLQTALPLSRKIKLLSKESLKATKMKKAFSELKNVQIFNNRKCSKCPFCYQYHD